MAVGGDVLSLTSNHSTLGSFVYPVLRNQDNTVDLGGDRTNDDANAKTGANEPVWQINGKLGKLSVQIVNDMTKKVAERLGQEAGSPVDSVWTFTHINGFTYKGTGRPVGDIVPNLNNTSLQVMISAPEFKQV